MHPGVSTTLTFSHCNSQWCKKKSKDMHNKGTCLYTWVNSGSNEALGMYQIFAHISNINCIHLAKVHTDINCHVCLEHKHDGTMTPLLYLYLAFSLILPFEPLLSLMSHIAGCLQTHRASM